jgi:hypothetical protein
MFEKLVEYKKQHKNTMVPQQYDPKLGCWVSTQRRNCRNDDMLPKRLVLLNSIGFEWEDVKAAATQIIWMNMFQKLVAYKEQHKDTRVPKQYNENPKLGRWCRKQREKYKIDKLWPKRVDHLNSIGFKWNRKGEFEQLWMGMFQKLITYKNLHKDTKVPTKYDEDPKLF